MRINLLMRSILVAEATKPRVLFVSMLFVLMSPSLSRAHAFLDHAVPKVGSTVDASPSTIALTFTQSLEPAFSKVTVSDSAGKQVNDKDAHVDENEATLMTVSVPKLAAGTYTVEWKVTSVDTHRTHGSFTFTVQPK